MVDWDKINPGIRSLLSRLQEEVEEFGNVTISESTYWLIFKSERGAFAAINPSKRKARVFISCDPNRLDDPQQLAKPSRSSGGWKEKFPLTFDLREHDDLAYAINLIRQSYEFVTGRSIRKAEIRGKREFKERAVTHGDLLNMLREIGETLGFFAKVEENTPDGVYRCDVTWRDYEAHSPIKVFEVEVSHRIDHALSSLMHAYDVWRPESLYLIVLDEKDIHRAVKLVEPYVKGAFYRISRRLRIYTYTNVKELYESLQAHKEFVRDLSTR